MNGLYVRGAHARGFTLVEVMTAMAILVLLTTMALVLYIQGSHHFARTSTDLDAEREARAAMGYTTAELRQAMPPLDTNNGPVLSPVATTPMPNPSPTPTSQVVFFKVEDITQGLNGTAVNTGALQYDEVVIEPSPVPSAQPNLMEYVYQYPSLTLLRSRVIGHDVATFAVTPIAEDEYDLTITTAPFIRTDLLDPANPSKYQYTLTSTIHVSYFPTNN
jgi:prepilin-type N-terminal cleavage/methylation domain-containing protein